MPTDRLAMSASLGSTSTARRLALAGVAAAVTLAGITVAPADAAPRSKAKTLRIVSPSPGAKVYGSVRLTGAAPRSARAVSFRVDAGRKRVARKRGRTRRDGGVLHTAPLRAGRHTITLRAKVRGKLVTKRVRITVKKRRRTLRAGVAKGRTKPRKGETVLQPIESEPTETAPAPAPAAPAPGLPDPGETIFSDDFESGSFSRWEAVQTVSSDRARIVPAFGGRTGNVARFEVRHGDHVNGEQDSRSELGWGGDGFSEGETHTFSWSTYYAPDYTAEHKWSTQAQFKGEGTGGPPLEIAVEDDRFLLRGDERTDWGQLYNIPLVRGRWMDITIRVHFSNDAAKGNVEMWHDGQKVVDNYKMATLKADGRTSYFKLGLYRDTEIVQTGVVYHDDLRITQG